MPVRWTIHSSEVSTCLGQFGIGHDTFGQGAAYAQHHGTLYGHDEAAPTAGVSFRRSARRESGRNLGEQFVAGDVMPEFDGSGKSFGIGTAVGLDDDPVQPKENATIVICLGPSSYAAH